METKNQKVLYLRSQKKQQQQQNFLIPFWYYLKQCHQNSVQLKFYDDDAKSML